MTCLSIVLDDEETLVIVKLIGDAETLLGSAHVIPSNIFDRRTAWYQRSLLAVRRERHEIR
jgi:hypothetical protein